MTPFNISYNKGCFLNSSAILNCWSFGEKTNSDFPLLKKCGISGTIRCSIPHRYSSSWLEPGIAVSFRKRPVYSCLPQASPFLFTYLALLIHIACLTPVSIWVWDVLGNKVPSEMSSIFNWFSFYRITLEIMWVIRMEGSDTEVRKVT